MEEVGGGLALPVGPCDLEVQWALPCPWGSTVHHGAESLSKWWWAGANSGDQAPPAERTQLGQMHHLTHWKFSPRCDVFADFRCPQISKETIWLLLSFRGKQRPIKGILFPEKEVESESCLVMSNSLWPHGLYSPWNSPGQNTGVGSCSILQGIFPTQVFRIASGFFTSWATREAQEYWSE